MGPVAQESQADAVLLASRLWGMRGLVTCGVHPRPDRGEWGWGELRKKNGAAGRITARAARRARPARPGD